jgi:hypothetical protein
LLLRSTQQGNSTLLIVKFLRGNTLYIDEISINHFFKARRRLFFLFFIHFPLAVGEGRGGVQVQEREKLRQLLSTFPFLPDFINENFSLRALMGGGGEGGRREKGRKKIISITSDDDDERRKRRRKKEATSVSVAHYPFPFLPCLLMLTRS